jgi:hypothetical protein
MLKRKLILLFFLSFAIYLNAQQDPFKPSTHIGVYGGINFSSVRFKPTLKQSLLSSQSYGIVFRHVSEPNIGVQLEVGIAGKGWKEVIDSVGTYTRKLQTINVPMLAAFIAGKRTIRIAFTIGPYISYLRHEDEIINITETNQYRPHYLKPLVTKWEFGFTGGAAFEVHTGIGAFAIRASYSHALSNLFPLSEDEYYFSASRGQVIHGGVMYFFTF